MKYLKKTLRCRNTIVLGLHFYQGLQIVLVSKLLWLLGFLQLLDAPEDSLTTSALSGVLGAPQALSSEAVSPFVNWPEAMGTDKGSVSLTWTRHIDLSCSEEESSLLETPASFQGKAVHPSIFIACLLPGTYPHML